MENNTKAILLALVCTLIVSFAQIFLKFGSENFAIHWTQIYNFPLVLGFVLYVIGSVSFIFAFRLGEMSVVYPVMASSYITVTLLSVYFLKEVILFQKWVGIVIITIGVFFIGKGGKK
jgi:drug/metabolite transporter (DMT)-like permease